MFQVRQMVRIAMLSAIGIILFYFISFPLPLFPEFLTYDAGDIPAMVATFVMGPWAAVLIQFIKAFLGLLLGASKAGWIGATANFLAGGTMVLVSGLLYSRWKTRTMAIVSMVVGSAATAIVMGAVNYYWLFPIWGIPQNQLMPMLISATIPFNFVKFIISSFVTYLLYKKVKHLL
ncbi:MAG: ECF transporter S component [Firmicutes bacterium HGW-Firmicutes-12]|nr:MAG: ECF transporter S component [Firmicutes bacterium HGW-Firmicutes-12]